MLRRVHRVPLGQLARGAGARPGPASGWKNSSGGPSPATLTCSLSRPSQTSTVSSRTASGPAAITTAPSIAAARGHQWFSQPSRVPDRPKPRQHLRGEQRDVLLGQVARHRAVLQHHQQVADPELAHERLDLVGDRRRAADDRDLAVHDLGVTSPSSSARASRPAAAAQHGLDGGGLGVAGHRHGRAAGSRPGPTGRATRGAWRTPARPARRSRRRRPPGGRPAGTGCGRGPSPRPCSQ